mgnify:CR=1 FL=1
MKKQIFSKVFLGLFIIGLSSIIISNHVFLPLVQRLANLCFNAGSTNNFNDIRVIKDYGNNDRVIIAKTNE